MLAEGICRGEGQSPGKRGQPCELGGPCQGGRRPSKPSTWLEWRETGEGMSSALVDTQIMSIFMIRSVSIHVSSEANYFMEQGKRQVPPA